MKRINITKIIWISGIFIILFIALYLVVIYKVKYENMEVQKYLYFYNCSDALCLTTNSKGISEEKMIYSKYECQNDICPLIDRTVSITEKIITLTLDTLNTKILYNYGSGKIISSEYMEYYPLVFEEKIKNYVVYSNDLYGLIDTEGNIIIDIAYQKLGSISNNIVSQYSYKNDYITALKDDKWGIISLSTGESLADFQYDSYESLKEIYSILK